MHCFSPLSPVASNHFLKSSVQDDGFLEWHRRGLVCFKDMFIDGTLASFEQLEVSALENRMKQSVVHLKDDPADKHTFHS